MKNFVRSLPGKLLLFLGTLLAGGALLACIAGAFILMESAVYSMSAEELEKEAVQSAAMRELYGIAAGMGTDRTEWEDSYTNLRFIIMDLDGRIVAKSKSLTDTDPDSMLWEYSWYVVVSDNSDGSVSVHPHNRSNINEESWRNSDTEETLYTVYAYVNDSESGLVDDYTRISWLVHMMYAVRYWILAAAAVSGILTAVCFFGLMCVSGRKPGTEEVIPGPLNQIPSDLLTAVILAVGCVGAAAAVWVLQDGYSGSGDLEMIIAAVIVAGIYYLLAGSLGLGLCMSAAARIKQKTLLRNTVCARCIRLSCRMIRGTWKIIREIPLVWKTAAAFLVICFIDFVLLMFAEVHSSGSYLPIFFLEKLILGIILIGAALNLHRLKRGGEALAKGDLSYQVDTGHMMWDFRRHGENLNRIADGMTAAVEQRMKSERMKTELITNVSHDIKTPLTSIISYADLIGKEPCENEKIKEYAEVLVRQSDRLKRLIEDLVEASKASTGNLEVLLAPCDSEIFLTQVSGEYELKLQECGLELIVSEPEHPVRVMADGRRMQRIFDNLMNNICKYAQPGTRVYLSLTEKDRQAVITLKNTSCAPLNVSADELLERFVRGDSSRKTEGNGLGLSIARSLAELQNGTLELQIDGDLFKVILQFPVIK